MRYIGLLGRISLILTMAIVLIQLAGLVLYYSQQGNVALGYLSSPLLERAVSVAKVLDPLDANQRQIALQAVNATGVSVFISKQPQTALEADALVLGRISKRLAQELDAAGLSGRFAQVQFAKAGDDDTDLGPISRLTGRVVRVVVRLSSGDFLVLVTSERFGPRLLGLPVGVAAVLFGSIVAAIALLAVFREMRPLIKLTKKVEAFGSELEVSNFPEQGARELRTLIQAFNGMQCRIVTLVENRTLLVGAISHDLRTYLTRLRLRVEMMPDGIHRDRAIVDVESMQQIIEDSLIFVRANLDSDGETTDLVSVAKQSMEAFRADGKGQISMAVTEQKLPVVFNPNALRRVIDNLVDNALKYGGSASITFENGDKGTVLCIDDSGPGIPDEFKTTVFEPFYRIEPSRNREYGGTGLGLSIVKQILERFEARIEFMNRDGGGLRAMVHLRSAPVS